MDGMIFGSTGAVEKKGVLGGVFGDKGEWPSMID